MEEQRLINVKLAERLIRARSYEMMAEEPKLSGAFAASIGYLDKCPTIDPVHAAGACYCWECKYEVPTEEQAEETNALWCERQKIWCQPDHFCGYGKPKPAKEN